jgi:uncharacterized protein (TIGR03437 family)
VPTGDAASGISNTVTSFTATIAGMNAPIAFSGLAPGAVGEDQLNLTIPTGAPSGQQDLVLTGGGGTSNTVKIQIQ